MWRESWLAAANPKRNTRVTLIFMASDLIARVQHGQGMQGRSLSVQVDRQLGSVACVTPATEVKSGQVTQTTAGTLTFDFTISTTASCQGTATY
jgi:hypothetical protein